MAAILGASGALGPAPRILLVKTSSLGDVVHNLPVVSDIRRHFPAAHIEWVVEEGFADIPRLHPGVNAVIPVAIRRWRKQLFSQSTRAEIGQVRQALSDTPYDCVIDTQGLLKSALLARWAKGPIHGYASDSIREPLASWFYDFKHVVSKAQHALPRNRQLVAASCGYSISDTFDYGLAAPLVATHSVTSPYVVLLSATSRDDKLWPESNWVALGHALAKQGVRVVCPGGTPAERARALSIALSCDGFAPEPMSVAALAALMQGASGIVGVDTGLTHLAAALGRPTLALFCASEPGLTGVFAPQPVYNLGAKGQPPSVAEVIAHCEGWAL